MRIRDALIVGLAQGAAIFPGISRSGSTIGAATLLGLEREVAVRYSFLLGAPAILGAAVLKTDGEAVSEVLANLPAYGAGLLAAILVGYASLSALVWLARTNRLHHFAWYCWALGASSLAWLALA